MCSIRRHQLSSGRSLRSPRSSAQKSTQCFGLGGPIDKIDTDATNMGADASTSNILHSAYSLQSWFPHIACCMSTAQFENKRAN